jgi:hypothetical protein
MAVTSEQLFEFVKQATISEVKLDAEGTILFASNPPLTGEPLSKALEVIAGLACREQEYDLHRKQFGIGNTLLEGTGGSAN